MARYGIVSLNYVTAGEKRLAVNMDTVVSYDVSAFRHQLVSENLSDELGLESLFVGIEAKLSCCSERGLRAISAFNESRLSRNRSFVLETCQQDDGQNRLELLDEDGIPVRGRLAMYDMLDEAMKTAEKKNRSTLPKIGEAVTTDDEYVPALTRNPLQFVQVGERTYFMTEPTTKSYQNLRTDVDPYAGAGEEFYRGVIKTNEAKTYLYGSLSSLSAESYARHFGYDNLTISALQDKVDAFFQPAEEIRGVEYNHLFGMLHGWDSMYQSGNVYGDTYTMKNMYDATYSMNMPDSGRLVRAREYDGMCVNGGTLFFKYRDDVSYERAGQGWRKSVPDERAFQKVERFQPVKSQDLKKSKHSSNYFSVNLKGLKLGDPQPDSDLEARAEAIRSDIRNAVRKIATALSPANTQLFEVTFEG